MNDLIGLEYQWGAKFSEGQGKTDCFQLVCEVRKRLGLSDLASRFAWTYELYTAQTLRPVRLARWLLQEGKRLKLPEHGAIALLADSTNPALGSVVRGSIVFIAPGKQVVRVPVSRVPAYFFWID